MSEADADQKAEMPEQTPKVGGGTAEGRGRARQTDAARDDEAGNGQPGLLEEVLRRENLKAGWFRRLGLVSLPEENRRLACAS